MICFHIWWRMKTLGESICSYRRFKMDNFQHFVCINFVVVPVHQKIIWSKRELKESFSLCVYLAMPHYSHHCSFKTTFSYVHCWMDRICRRGHNLISFTATHHQDSSIVPMWRSIRVSTPEQAKGARKRKEKKK